MNPDDHSRGFTTAYVDPLRYNSGGENFDPEEAPGLILKMLPPGARVLDVGCSSGEVTRLLKNAGGAEVIGVEPHVARAQKAIDSGLDVRIGVLTDELVEELGTFDVVTFVDVLEHLPDPGLILQMARKALRPGGVVLISVPNVAHWTVRVNLLRGKFEYKPEGLMDATHLRWFTAANLDLLLKSTGFRIVEKRVSLGRLMPDYAERRPWRWLPEKRRSKIVRWMAKTRPELFGLQHVVKAELCDPAV